MRFNVLKRVSLSLILVASIVSSSASAFAATSETNPSAAPLPDSKVVSINQAKTGKDIVISDEKQLQDAAAKDGVPLVKNGKKLTKIEYQYVENVPEKDANKPSVNNTKTISPESWDTLYYYVKSTTNYGSGWYNATDDLIADLYWDGPDTAVVSETHSYNASVNSNLGVSNSGISAAVGFTIGGSYSITFSSSTPVPSGSSLNVKVYRTFQKVSFDSWEHNAFQADKYYGTGYAYKPNGAYFAKYWY